jgi:hypothetical protein
VLIDFLPAATVTTMATCVGPPDVIVKGSTGVMINYLPAARLGDQTAHGGVIVLGSVTCIIGEVGSPSPGAGGVGSVAAGLVVSFSNAPSALASLYAMGLKAGSALSDEASKIVHSVEGVVQNAEEAIKKFLQVKIPPQCSYLEKGFRSEGPASQFDANRQKAEIGPAQPISYTFPGATGPSDAIQQTVTIGTKSITVIEPKNGPVEPGTVLPSVEQVAKSLGAVPAVQLGYLKEVVVSPLPNPADAHWAEVYKMPGFRSEATAGAEGTVNWYPIPKDSAMIPDETMVHESGHTFSFNIWKKPADWKPWQDAMASDGRAPSKYADSSKEEDFSESLVMYTMSKGTGCEETARKLFPGRYKILDSVLSGKSSGGGG